MGTVTLVATTPFVYAERSLSTGDSFEASEKDATLLKTIGRAVEAPKERPRLIRTRDLEPESESATTDASKPKRQYRRRDLEPEP